MNKIQRALAIAAAAFCVAGAQAATMYSADFSSTGFRVSPDSMSTTFSAAAAGSALINFELAGLNTLDGDNNFIDIFHLSLNGSEIFTGAFNLGGDSRDRIILAPTGSNVTRLAPQLLDISVPLNLLAGSNTFTFSYTSPIFFEGSYRAGPQGIVDEGWGVGRISVSAVPEPQTYALLLGGLGIVGLTMARRQRNDR